MLSCEVESVSVPGSSIHGILQARMLEWAAISSSRWSSPPRDQTCISRVSWIGRWILYPLRHLGSLKKLLLKDRSSSYSASHHSSILAGHLCLIKFTMTFQSYFFWEKILRGVFFWLLGFCLARRGLSCSMWAPVPQPGIKPQPPALTMWNLKHCTIMEVPIGM